MAENWNRQDKIRAGAVSGPWRSVPRKSDDADPGAIATSATMLTQSCPEDTPRAPSLRAVEPVLLLTNPKRAPLTAVPAQPEPAAIRTGTARAKPVAPPARNAAAPKRGDRSNTHQYSVLGAVLLGSLIAGAIIALAFLLRPAADAPSQAVTPKAGAVVVLNPGSRSAESRLPG